MNSVASVKEIQSYLDLRPARDMTNWTCDHQRSQKLASIYDHGFDIRPPIRNLTLSFFNTHSQIPPGSTIIGRYIISTSWIKETVSGLLLPCSTVKEMCCFRKYHKGKMEARIWIVEPKKKGNERKSFLFSVNPSPLVPASGSNSFSVLPVNETELVLVSNNFIHKQVLTSLVPCPDKRIHDTIRGFCEQNEGRLFSFTLCSLLNTDTSSTLQGWMVLSGTRCEVTERVQRKVEFVITISKQSVQNVLLIYRSTVLVLTT